jgi:hypothetical protein
MNFINFMPFNINNIKIFQHGSLCLWSMMQLWWFWNIYKSILLWPVFCFFLKVHQGFFPFNLWHHPLNQHIHIETMYPSGITHFNAMIFIPLCENCKLCTYGYHLVWVFIFFPQYSYCAMVYKFQKKSSTRTRWVC